MSLILESFEDIIKSLELKQIEILTLHGKLKDKEQENQAKVQELVKPLQDELDAIGKELSEKKAIYRAETKKYFGIADGEPSDILDLVKAIKRVSTSA